jgi:hypothetical protein
MVGGSYFANFGALALLRDFGMAVGLSGALPLVCWPSAGSAVTGEVKHDTDDRARRISDPCEIRLRSTPSCVPSIGKTIRSPVRALA